MSGQKKPSILRQSSYNSLYVNPLNDPNHNRSCSEGISLGNHLTRDCVAFSDNKENATPNKKDGHKENAAPTNGSFANPTKISNFKSFSTGRVLKPSSLEFCMKMNEPDSGFGSKLCEPIGSETSSSLNVWDYSDSEAAPAASWSTLPNRTLLCRPLPLDIGRCTCVVVKEASPEGGMVYSLYTNEGQGRQDRKLAVARHSRRNGRSQFTISQNTKGLSFNSDDSSIGIITSNLMGSKYQIWDQGCRRTYPIKSSRPPLAVVIFMPTVATWTGSYRGMKAFVPKHQSMQLKNTMQVQHIQGLPKDWNSKMEKVHQLVSRVPHYNHISKQYELDFRDRGRAGLRIQSSVKNFQLTLEENGKQTILQFGRVEKSKYVMDYRYPLTGYQAFCICLASIDSKLCCTV